MQSSVLEWLNKTASEMPDKIALCDENAQITYKEYRDRSLMIAQQIVSILPESRGRHPVVVYIEKSVKVLVSFLGIIYSGNFYSPVDVICRSRE